jgi:hypothetical protein
MGYQTIRDRAPNGRRDAEAFAVWLRRHAKHDQAGGETVGA